MIRTIRSWFTTPTTSKDRFVTNDKPTQTNFQKLFDAVTFVAEKADTAKLTEQGLAKKTLDGLAISKPSPSAYNDGMTRFIESHQIPDVIAENTSIVVTPVIWDATDSAIVGAVVTGHDCRRRYLISFGANETWKTIGAGGTMANGEAVPNFASSDITNYAASQNLQLRKQADGQVQMRGYITVDNFDANSPLMLLLTLPVGYRPAVVQRFDANAHRVTTVENAPATIGVAANGQVLLTIQSDAAWLVIPGTYTLDLKVNLLFDTV